MKTKKKTVKRKQMEKSKLKVKRTGAIRMLYTREVFMIIGAALVGAGITHFIIGQSFPFSLFLGGLGFVLLIIWA